MPAWIPDIGYLCATSKFRTLNGDEDYCWSLWASKTNVGHCGCHANEANCITGVTHPFNNNNNIQG